MKYVGRNELKRNQNYDGLKFIKQFGEENYLKLLSTIFRA